LSVAVATAAEMDTTFWTSPPNHGSVPSDPKSTASTLISSDWV